MFTLVQKLVDGECGSSPCPAKAACACASVEVMIEAMRRRTTVIGKDFNGGPLCVRNACWRRCAKNAGQEVDADPIALGWAYSHSCILGSRKDD